MDLSELRKTNVARCQESFHPLAEWSATDWATAMAGECGEACNAIKKLRRFDSDRHYPNTPDNRDTIIDAIADELADTIIYIDLLAASLGINLSQAVRHKFNAVSERVGSDKRL